MTKFLLSTTAIVLAVPAFGADMARPITKAPPMIAPSYNWTGSYIGAQGGWQGGRDHTAEYTTSTGAFHNFDQGFHPNGAVGGGHIGCTFQENMWVWGIEGRLRGCDG